MQSYIQKFGVTQRADANPLRRVQVGSYDGHNIEVVTGYDISHDAWRVHIYIQAPGETTLTKQAIGELFGSDEREAYAVGWRDVERILTR